MRSFLLLAFAWSWGWWWTAVAIEVAVTEPPGLLLYLLGVFGPLVAAARVAHPGGHAHRHEVLRRVWDPRGIPARSWLVLLGVAVGPGAVAAAALALAGRPVLASGLSASVAAVMAGQALVAGLVEEPGWRGVVLDAWQARTRPVWAATGIGVVWSLWHVPLSHVEGSYYEGLGAWSLRWWLTHLVLVQLGILLVWLVNGAGRSILLAVLAHAGFNLMLGLVAGSTTRDVVVLLALVAAVAAVLGTTRDRLGLPATSANGAVEPAGALVHG